MLAAHQHCNGVSRNEQKEAETTTLLAFDGTGQNLVLSGLWCCFSYINDGITPRVASKHAGPRLRHQDGLDGSRGIVVEGVAGYCPSSTTVMM
jgi:hypothetical protein